MNSEVEYHREKIESLEKDIKWHKRRLEIDVTL